MLNLRESLPPASSWRRGGFVALAVALLLSFAASAQSDPAKKALERQANERRIDVRDQIGDRAGDEGLAPRVDTPGTATGRSAAAVPGPGPTGAPGTEVAIAPDVDDVATGTAIRALLARDPAIPRDAVNVTVAGGVATIRGTVPSLFVRDRINEIVQSTRGVERVRNLVAVAGPARADNDILREVNSILAADPNVGSLRLGVAVANGEVVLSGDVDSWQTQEYITRLVKAVPGVRAIDSRITFSTPDQPDDAIAAQVQRRLQEDAWVDPGMVRVEVANGHVVLSGSVGSAFERNRALTDAWVPGVKSVNADALEVELGVRERMLRPAEARVVSDEALRGAVSNAFAFSPRVLSLDPQITVRDGVVTLDGLVDNRRAYREAERIARGVYGVRDVVNNLQVRGEERTVAAAESASKPVESFRAALRADAELKPFQISSQVTDEGFTLFGVVNSEEMKARAEQIARSATGFDNIVNNISVSEKWQMTSKGIRTSDQEIYDDLMDMLAWNPYVDSTDINVYVRNGVVTLDGTVNSWRDRAIVVQAAQAAGAVQIENNLDVLMTAAEEERQQAEAVANAAAAAAAAGTGAQAVGVPVPTASGVPQPGMVAPGGAGTVVPGAVDAPGTDVAIIDDDGLGVGVLPGSLAAGDADNDGVPDAAADGTVTDRVTQPTTVPTTGDSLAPGAAGVPGAGGTDPSVSTAPGAGGLTNPDTSNIAGGTGATEGDGGGATGGAPTSPGATSPGAGGAGAGGTAGAGGGAAGGGGGSAGGGGAAGAGGGAAGAGGAAGGGGAGGGR